MKKKNKCHHIILSVGVPLLFTLSLTGCESEMDGTVQSLQSTGASPGGQLARLNNVLEGLDFTNIKDHPRLILDTDDEVALVNSLYPMTEPLSDRQKIHKRIMEQCDSIVSDEPPLDLDGSLDENDNVPRLENAKNALRRIFYLSYCFRIVKNQIVQNQDQDWEEKKNRYSLQAKEDLNTIVAREDWNHEHSFLDVAELTIAAAIGYDWLFEDLENETTIKSKIQQSIRHKAFEKSANITNIERPSNWNQVCNAGLVIGALAIYGDPADPPDPPCLDACLNQIERSMESNDIHMENIYGTNGNYIEGSSYWDYGTGYEVMMLSALKSALGSYGGLNKYVDSDSGFVKSATYMAYMIGPTGLVFSYSDGSERRPIIPAAFWFAKEEQASNTSLAYLEAKKMGTYPDLNLSHPWYRLMPLELIFSLDVNLDNLSPPSDKTYNGISPSFEGPSVFVVRTGWTSDSKYLGIKGRHRNSGHSHLDAGSFVYDAYGYRWAVDLGAEEYKAGENAIGKDNFWNGEFQDSLRWSVFRHSSKSHNTITINRLNHNISGGAEFKESWENPQRSMGAKIDFAGAIDRYDALQGAYREVYIDPTGKLEIQDWLTANGSPVDVRWHMATPARIRKVDESNSTIYLAQGARGMLLKVASGLESHTAPIPVTPFELTVRSAKPTTDWSTILDMSGDPDKEKHRYWEKSNDGITMVGFDATFGASTEANQALFKVSLEMDPSFSPATVHATSQSSML